MRKLQRFFKRRWYFLMFIGAFSCVEEIDIIQETEFESILIIEATITNENSYQQILLSRTFSLEEEGPTPELGAIVYLNDTNGNHIEFAEETPGVYQSLIEFSALPNVEYQLEIETVDGRSYGTSVEQLTSVSSIDDVRFVRGFNENNQEGISVFVDALSASNEEKYYRHEYEETYKIIAPWYSPLELEILEEDFIYPQSLLFEHPSVQDLIDFFFDLVLREEQEQICYNTVKSNSIIINSTEDLIQNEANAFRVRFLNRNMPEIMHRYSILVKQFGQSKEAYTFYKTLREFSNLESVFSQVQTGFLEGNVFSETNENEKVIGYFEVASYDEKRVFFNYDDLFPGEIRPEYYISCNEPFSPPLLQEDFFHNITNSPVIDALNASVNTFIFYDINEDESPSPFSNSPFQLVLKPCGDCTVYGDNSVPDFWTEE